MSSGSCSWATNAGGQHASARADVRDRQAVLSVQALGHERAAHALAVVLPVWEMT